MVSRHGSDRMTLVQRVAAELDPELLDLRPFLADGVAGLRRHDALLRAALEVQGGGVDDLPALKAEIGVDTANCYRALLGVPVVDPGR
jgi:hypothetical protein